jgi:hypothetical protein
LGHTNLDILQWPDVATSIAAVLRRVSDARE